jgi:integrase/recombinase XerD
MDASSPIDPPVQFTFVYANGKLTSCTTNAPLINHFLAVVQMNRAYHTWVNYAHDLKVFFTSIPKAPETVTRQDCVEFMQQQHAARLADATINRRLATVSSLFKEFQVLGIVEPHQNPVHPGRADPHPHQHSQSLYRPQPQRLPDIVAQADLQTLFAALPTWRDRTIVFLMWLSCLRVSEVVALQFSDVECSRRSIRISAPKGGQPRLVFMDQLTFAALNRYLDEERKQLFPAVNALFVAFKGKARGQPLSVNAVQKLVAYYAKHCNIASLHPHLFRHTGITQLVRHHMPEPALRQFVGHRHPDSLLPYLHLDDEFIETEFERAQTTLNISHWLQVLPTGGV